MDDVETPICQAKGSGRRLDGPGQDVTGLLRSERLGRLKQVAVVGGPLSARDPVPLHRRAFLSPRSRGPWWATTLSPWSP